MVDGGVKWYTMYMWWEIVVYFERSIQGRVGLNTYYNGSTRSGRSSDQLETIKIMLIGEYKHTLDPKKRLSMPSKWRKELGRKLVVTRGLDNCLFVYPLKQWQVITDKIGQLPLGQSDTRSFNRFFLSGAVEVEVDSVGRILVPDFLKEFAGLDGKVTLAGIHDRVEIWDEKKWEEYKRRIESQADQLAESLGAIGVL